MGFLEITLLVFFVITAVLLILLVLIQNEEGDSLGGIFAGGGGSAFGSRSGNILTKATSILGAVFLLISLSLALLNRNTVDSRIRDAASKLNFENQEITVDTAIANWLENRMNPASADEEEEIENLSDIEESLNLE